MNVNVFLLNSLCPKRYDFHIKPICKLLVVGFTLFWGVFFGVFLRDSTSTFGLTTFQRLSRSLWLVALN